MTTLKVGIATYAEMKARTLAVARGERRIASTEPKVWFTSTESFAKVLSAGARLANRGYYFPLTTNSLVHPGLVVEHEVLYFADVAVLCAYRKPLQISHLLQHSDRSPFSRENCGCPDVG